MTPTPTNPTPRPGPEPRAPRRRRALEPHAHLMADAVISAYIRELAEESRLAEVATA
jgi:hypothetical protein